LDSWSASKTFIQAKPADAHDLCYLTGDTTFSTLVTDMAVCDADSRLVKHASPRQVAGAGIRAVRPRSLLQQPLGAKAALLLLLLEGGAFPRGLPAIPHSHGNAPIDRESWGSVRRS
jgi:hypothetical protein